MRATLLLFTLLFAATLFAASISAQPNKDGINGIYYNLNESTNTAEVTFCHFRGGDDDYLYAGEYNDYAYDNVAYKGVLTIPESFQYNNQTYVVTSIGDNAMFGCYNLLTLNLPKSISSFGNGWSSGCHSLQIVNIDQSNPVFQSVNGIVLRGNNIVYVPLGITGTVSIPDNVTAIPEGCFEKHRSVEQVIMHNNVSFVGSGAFNECTSLKSITLSESLPSIEDHTFYKCISLTDITIPASVQYIGSHAFTGSKVHTVSLSEGLKKICSYAFYNVSSLEHINIPNSLTTLENNALDGCTGIKEFHYGKSLSSMGANAMNGVSPDVWSAHNDNMMYTEVSGILYNKQKTEIMLVSKALPDEVIIPSTVTSIPERLLEKSSVKKLTIENGIAELPEYFCNFALSLEEVNIPASVSFIHYFAFTMCYNLTHVNIDSDNPYYFSDGALILLRENDDIIIDQVCPGASAVVVPEYVTATYGDVFVGTNVQSISFSNTTPPALHGFLDYFEIPENCTLFVPDNCIESYSNALSLNEYADISTWRPSDILNNRIDNNSNNAKLICHDRALFIVNNGKKYSLLGSQIRN